MTDPLTTEAGRALLYGLDRLMPEKHDDAVAKIAAIEQEARADTAALVAAVRDWMAFGAGDGTDWAEGESERLATRIAREYAVLEATE